MQIRLQIRLPGLRSNPHWAARHKPANPPSSTQCLARNASNPLELASEQETMNLPTARHARASRARIARASRPHRARGGRGCARATRAFCYYNNPRHYFFRSIAPTFAVIRAPMFAYLRAVLPLRCGLPRPHACVFYGVFNGVIRSTPLLFGCFFTLLCIRVFLGVAMLDLGPPLVVELG